MKKTTLIVASLLMLFSLKANAQNERMLLLESFTNTGCGPCAAYNPAMDALIAANPDKVAAIKYHVNWPSAADPMYLHNTAENGARTSYYGVNSVPHVVIDGNRYSSNPAQLNQNILNQLQTLESPMEMRLSYEVNEAENTITVHVMGRTSTAIEGNFKLYVGVIEREIHFNSAPGPNGERDFYSVMKKLLPGSGGQALGSLNSIDSYFAYTYTWELANIYDMSQLDAIAWVQNSVSKEVVQACKSSENMEPFYANEAMLSDISNMKGTNCSGEAKPEVLLTNNGSNALTSVEMEVLVNEKPVKTVEWTGNLPTFGKTTVDLGEISFDLEDENTLEVAIVNINGGLDEVPTNDIADYDFKAARQNVAKEMKLSIRTDANPQETTWKVTNLLTGEVVLEGGPYEQANTMHTEILDITSDGCYDFTIYDAGGNGLVGGVYGLKAGGTTLFSGGTFGFSESNEFSYEVTADVDENFGTGTSIYPNPTTGLMNIVGEGVQNVTIYSMAGQRVFEGQCDGWLQIDMKRFGAGVYAVQVGEETQRIVVK
ncbi:MAG: Omp28-related outer membrane protein [Bacteroidales bacterium]|nr:Omp28-related outer membrane protein [Bacteroidales bacterium]